MAPITDGLNCEPQKQVSTMAKRIVPKYLITCNHPFAKLAVLDLYEGKIKRKSKSKLKLDLVIKPKVNT